MTWLVGRKEKQWAREIASDWVDWFDLAARSHGLQTGRSPLYVRAEIRNSVYLYRIKRTSILRLGSLLNILGLLDLALQYQWNIRIGEPISLQLQTANKNGDDEGPSWSSWALVAATAYMLFLWWNGRQVHSQIFHRPKGYRRHTVQPVPALCAVLLVETSRALISPIPRRRAAYRRVDEVATQLVRFLPKLAADRQLVPRKSSRRKAMKEHTALVAAAIQRAASKIDSEPTLALSELAELSHTIATRWAERRSGALLDSSHLSGLTPIRSHETLRLLSAVILTVGAAVGIGFLEPPAAATPLLVGGIGLVCFSLVYGHNSPRPLELLDSVRGIQRP